MGRDHGTPRKLPQQNRYMDWDGSFVDFRYAKVYYSYEDCIDDFNEIINDNYSIKQIMVMEGE